MVTQNEDLGNTKVTQNEDFRNTKVTQGNTKVTQKLDLLENLENKKKFFKCKNCEKQFLKKNSYYRHMKHRLQKCAKSDGYK